MGHVPVLLLGIRLEPVHSRQLSKSLASTVPMMLCAYRHIHNTCGYCYRMSAHLMLGSSGASLPQTSPWHAY
eukprot:3769764-Amphidinium_carterae.1